MSEQSPGEPERPMTAEDVVNRTHPNRDPANESLYFGRHDEAIIDGENREITGYCYNDCDLVAQPPAGYDAACQFALGSHRTRLALHFGATGDVPSVGVYHHDDGWGLVSEPDAVLFPRSEARIRFENIDTDDELRWEGRVKFCSVTNANDRGVYVEGPRGARYRIQRRGLDYRVYRRSGSMTRDETVERSVGVEIREVRS